MPCAKWHWDFTPGHVFYDDNKISVIDITGIDNTPIFEDVGRFLASLSTVNNLPFYPLFNHKLANIMLCDNFVEEYIHNIDFDHKLFVFFSNLYKLKYLIIWFCGQHYRVANKLSSKFADYFANYRLVKIFEEPLLMSINNFFKSISTL